jgi:hypothetical protein
MRLDSAQTARVIATAAFLVAMTSYVVLDKIVLPSTIGDAARSVTLLLSSLGVYSMVYGTAQWLMNTRLYRFVSRSTDLDGLWHQVFTLSGYEPGDYRHGTVMISATARGIVIAGSNFRPDGSYSSHWQSQAVLVDGLQLDVLFESTGLTRGRTAGTMSFSLVGSPPIVITGTFADSVPGPNCGEMRLFRSEDAAEEYKEHLASAGSART